MDDDEFNRNEFAIKAYSICLPISDYMYREWFGIAGPWEYPDDPFRNYRPFPEWDRAERRVRTTVTEVTSRLTAAWKVLRHGDRDPFGEGCDCW